MGRNKSTKYIGIDENVTRLYKSKKGLKKIDINEFQAWYKSKNESCDYCGLTEEQSSILFDKYPNSTRGGRRGKRLELDRIDPKITDYGEDIKNLALSCYWCNSAKSNYFTSEESKKIGEVIKEIQKERLG